MILVNLSDKIFMSKILILYKRCVEQNRLISLICQIDRYYSMFYRYIIMSDYLRAIPPIKAFSFILVYYILSYKFSSNSDALYSISYISC